MSSVIDDLASWGPGATVESPVSRIEANAYCRRLAKSHYENFPVASLVLPRRLRQHFANVYAYCRWADDLADETGDPQRSLELLAWWRKGLERCYEGDVTHPVYVALRPTIDEFRIPKQPFVDLIAAFEQDQHIRRYDTFEQLLGYCERSANPVGRIILYLSGNVSGETLAWSDSICTGLQLANFWQDVARDKDVGRVYLPAEDRERFGYTGADLEQRVTNDAFLELMRFEVERAREFLTAGEPLIATMSGRLRVAVDMFLQGGLQILREIETIGYRVWETRPVVSKRRLAMLFASSLGRAMMRHATFSRTPSGMRERAGERGADG